MDTDQNTQIQQLLNANQYLSTSIVQLSKTLSAVIAIIGPDKVQEKLDEQHLERLQPSVDAAKTDIADKLASGQLAVAEISSDDSIVVIEERNERGAVNHPYLPIIPSDVRNSRDASKELVGKKIGDTGTVTIMNGIQRLFSTYTILAIYNQANPPTTVAAA